MLNIFCLFLHLFIIIMRITILSFFIFIVIAAYTQTGFNPDFISLSPNAKEIKSKRTANSRFYKNADGSETAFFLADNLTGTYNPETGSNWTGSVTGNGVIQSNNQLMFGYINSQWVCGWIKFNISALSKAALVNEVSLTTVRSSFYTGSYSDLLLWTDIKAMKIDPTGIVSGSELFNHIVNSRVYDDTKQWSDDKNSYSKSFTNIIGGVGSLASADVEEQIDKGWFAIAFRPTSVYYGYDTYAELYNGKSGYYHPVLSVTYNLPEDGLKPVVFSTSQTSQNDQYIINLKWNKVIDANLYDLNYSEDGKSWKNLYSGVDNKYSHNCGDKAAKLFYYTVTAHKTDNTTITSEVFKTYTQASAPTMPVVSSLGKDFITLKIGEDNNSDSVLYAIFCKTTSQYVQIDGSLSATPAYRSKKQWGNIKITGLTLGQEYCFYIIAENGTGVISYIPSQNILFQKEEFNSDIINSISKTNKQEWRCITEGQPEAADYIASGGNSGGYAGYKGITANRYMYSFLRMPSINCTGRDKITLSFDMANSFISSHYKPTNQYGSDRIVVSADDNNLNTIMEKYLVFDKERKWEHIEIDIDLTGVSNKAVINIVFSIYCPFENTDTQIYLAGIDNVMVYESLPPLCVTTQEVQYYKVEGKVNYNNTSKTPLSDVTVFLNDKEGAKIDSTQTDVDGTYVFQTVSDGDYFLTAKTKKAQKGVNPIDALIINRYFISLFSFPDKFRKSAADVNKDGLVNPLDALYINRRFIGILKFFPSGDWLFEKVNINVNGAAVNQDIKGICFGDVDASY